MMAMRTMKYNPAFLTEDELVESFVVRQTDLDLVMRVIRENTAGANQHVMVIGPRGIGKTTLVLRAVAEVHRTEELNARWYPLVFAEESYQVTTPGEFWLEALLHLANQTGEEGWKRAHAELLDERDEDILRERALAQLMDFADGQGKRVMLVVENLNMLLGDQLSQDDAWVIRHTLLNEPRVMLLASATRRFEGIENGDKAFFELFHEHQLRPLNTEECARVWVATTGKEVKEREIRPIEILTGGSPRLLTIVASFGARMSLKDLLNDLTQLVDDHTEYFKSHLEALPATERKVYLALAELWGQVTAKEVAQAARLDVSATSALLKRLVDRGAVVVAGQEGRKKWYQVAERMYNIYYLMRRRGTPLSRVEVAVRFMLGIYGPECIPDLTRCIAEETCQHTLACVLCGSGKGEEALAPARRYLDDTELVKKNVGDAIELCVALAASGFGREALELLRESPSADALEPLVVGLQLYVGETTRAPVELVEIGKDIVKRIKERCAQFGARKASVSV